MSKKSQKNDDYNETGYFKYNSCFKHNDDKPIYYNKRYRYKKDSDDTCSSESSDENSCSDSFDDLNHCYCEDVSKQHEKIRKRIRKHMKKYRNPMLRMNKAFFFYNHQNPFFKKGCGRHKKCNLYYDKCPDFYYKTLNKIFKN